MDLLTMLAAYGAAALIVLVLGAVMLALWRGDAGVGSVLLEKMLRRQSDDAARRALASGSRDFAIAVQRCVSCNEGAQCSACLASGAREGYETFCPNAGYVRRQSENAKARS